MAAKKHKFVTQAVDDTIIITVDDHYVGTFDHDTDGYHGMQRAEELVEAIAKLIGATFVKV